jgi:hypothetical protein
MSNQTKSESPIILGDSVANHVNFVNNLTIHAANRFNNETFVRLSDSNGLMAVNVCLAVCSKTDKQNSDNVRRMTSDLNSSIAFDSGSWIVAINPTMVALTALLIKVLEHGTEKHLGDSDVDGYMLSAINQVYCFFSDLLGAEKATKIAKTTVDPVIALAIFSQTMTFIFKQTEETE